MSSSRFGKFALSAFALLVPLGGAAAQEKPWVVGNVAALTGPVALIGTRLTQPAEMWAEKVNAEGGINGRKVELRSCDDGNDPQKSVACVRDFIDHGAVIVLGNTLFTNLLAIQPLVHAGPILMVPSPNMAPKLDTYNFLVSPTEDMLTQAVANFAKANKVKKVGVIATADASGEGTLASFERIFKAENIELKTAQIDLKATDASDQLKRVASDDVGLVHSVYAGGGAVNVVKNFHDLGLKQPLVVNYASMGRPFLNLIKDFKPARLLGTAIASVVPETLKSPGERERTEAFMAAYAKKYSAPADMNNMIGKAEVDVADAILRKSSNPADLTGVKTWLETHPVESVLDQKYSPTSHVGVTASDLAVVELKGDNWGPADPLK